MNLLIKSAKIVDPNSAHNGKSADILIENGTIKSIKANIKAEKGIKNFEAKNLHVSPGWFDMQVNFRDPGFENKEDLLSGSKAASYGGFTGVAVMPSTHPPVHTKADVEYVKNKTKNLITDIFPVGALSHNMEGKDISEMYDMHLSGAIAFSDDKNSVANAGLLMRALLYAKNFGGLIITHCDEKSISLDGKMNEGETSTALGLKSSPALAEELMVARNIYLAEYTESKIHFTSISTAKSVDLIRQAKSKKLKVTAAVNVYNLMLDDSSLKDFDTNYKVNPPLRIKSDIEALKKGLADGSIDVIVSDHSPEDEESKKVEFDHAAFGMTGLETAFAIANSNRGKLTLEQLINKISIRPRQILNIEVPQIKEGEKANLTMFDPDLKWKFEEKHIQSKSKNTPFIGTSFTGKALGVCNNNSVVIC